MKHSLTALLKNIALLSPPKRLSTSLSDNQAYPQACLEATSNYRAFNNFRRNPVYNTILEHVSKEQGQRYLNLISSDEDLIRAFGGFKANDDHGNPRMYEYSGVGWVSPTTLRYVKVLADLKMHFISLDGLNICEIGVGYGGQCRIINAHYWPATYCLVDIKPALALAQRYLDNYVLNSVITYRTMNELGKREFDLVLSNYAFTELPRPVQDVYLDRVILNSRMGYITYNEISPVEFRSYGVADLVGMIPGSRTVREDPLTHPKNCVIVWGHSA